MAPSSTSSPDPNDAIKPYITTQRISFTFTGDALDKTVGNWKIWSSNIRDDLDMSGLGSHIDDAPLSTPPDAATHPNAFRNWTTNDRAARAYMKRNCATVESDILENLATARECWKALQTLHLDEGPIKQVNLIQNALAQRIARDKEQVTKVRQVRKDIRRAFRMPGGITEEMFVNITCLIVLGAGHDHLRTMIQRDMQAATSTNPFLSEQIISYLEQDLQLLEGDEQRNGTAGQAVALATQSAPPKTSKFNCSNCKKTSHTAEYCVRSGGGMAGKSIAESMAARRKALDAAKTTSSGGSAKQKIPVTFKDTEGRAYIAHIDAETVTSNAARTEHMTLSAIDTSDPSFEVPKELTTLEEVEHAEYEGWLTCVDRQLG
ncbi:hypothetical protein BDZ97DRAFT_1918168 [Flammula alnicola]|nr:hypothetical protein BDZ97DRAFT_1918168 [Flammula alnicola]